MISVVTVTATIIRPITIKIARSPCQRMLREALRTSVFIGLRFSKAKSIFNILAPPIKQGR